MNGDDGFFDGESDLIGFEEVVARPRQVAVAVPAGPAAPPPDLINLGGDVLPVRSPEPVPVSKPVTDGGSGVRTTSAVPIDVERFAFPEKFGPGPQVQPPAPQPRVIDMIEEDVLDTELDFAFDGPARPGGVSFVHKRIIGAAVGLVTGGPGGAVQGFFGGGGGGAPAPQPTRFTGADRGQNLGSGCPASTTRNPRTGLCERSGAGAAFQRFVPGGRTGTLRDDFGEAVMGSFNVPALVPAQRGTIERQDGTVGPILRCPRGMVLAIDNLCYAKGTKGLAAFRKWPPGTRPFLTGGEVRILRRAETLRKGKGTRSTLKALGLGG